MTGDPKADLLDYLRHGREAVVWKLDAPGEVPWWAAHRGHLRRVADGFA